MIMVTDIMARPMIAWPARFAVKPRAFGTPLRGLGA